MLAVAQPQIVAGIVALPWAKSASERTRPVRLRGGTPQGTRSSGREALVPVMKAADLGQLHDLTPAGRAHVPRVGRVLAERQMDSLPVVVPSAGLRERDFHRQKRRKPA